MKAGALVGREVKMRTLPRPIEAVVLLTSALYFGYGALVNLGTLAIANGLAGVLGCCAPAGQEAVTGQWKLFLLGLFFLVAFVTNLSVGVGAFKGVDWLKKGMQAAGALGLICCLLSLLWWGAAGFGKYIFLATSLFILVRASSTQLADPASLPEGPPMAR